MIQGRIVTKLEGFVHRKPEGLSAVGHYLRLFDGVNTQFTLKILVELKEILRIARVPHDDGDDACLHLGGHLSAGLNLGGLLPRGRGLGRLNGGSDGGCSLAIAHRLDVGNHVVESRVLPQLE